VASSSITIQPQQHCNPSPASKSTSISSNTAPTGTSGGVPLDNFSTSAPVRVHTYASSLARNASSSVISTLRPRSCAAQRRKSAIENETDLADLESAPATSLVSTPSPQNRHHQRKMSTGSGWADNEIKADLVSNAPLPPPPPPPPPPPTIPPPTGVFSHHSAPGSALHGVPNQNTTPTTIVAAALAANASSSSAATASTATAASTLKGNSSVFFKQAYKLPQRPVTPTNKLLRRPSPPKLNARPSTPYGSSSGSLASSAVDVTSLFDLDV
jgi:hypothetical protein